jgi:hypothetical protein
MRMLREIRRLIGDQLTGMYTKFCNEELHNLLSSSDINKMTKSKRLRWVGNVALMGQEKNAYKC